MAVTGEKYITSCHDHDKVWWAKPQYITSCRDHDKIWCAKPQYITSCRDHDKVWWAKTLYITSCRDQDKALCAKTQYIMSCRDHDKVWWAKTLTSCRDRGSSKQRKAEKLPIEYSDSLPAISSTSTDKWCCHSTNLLSVHTWNTQFNSEKIFQDIPEIKNHGYRQRLKDLNLIMLEQRRLRGQLIEVLKYTRRFNNATATGLFDRDNNDKTWNNGEKLILKRFNISIAQHLYPIKITTTWNALPSDIVGNRTVNTFKNRLDQHCMGTE